MNGNTEFKNISNGTTDGLVLFYMKDRKLYPVLLKKEQAEMLDLVIAVPFKEEGLNVASSPLIYEGIKDMIDI